MRNKQADDLTKGFEEIMKREYGVEFVDVTPDRPSPPAEPECECGHDADDHHNGKDCLWDNAEGEADLIVCRCESYRPPTTEPAESEGKPNLIEAVEHFIRVNADIWKGQDPDEYMNEIRERDTAPPAESVEDRAKAFDGLMEARRICSRQLRLVLDEVESCDLDSEVIQSAEKDWQKAAHIVANTNIDNLRDAIVSAEQYAAKQIERQTPAIIERFVEEVEDEYDNHESVFDAIQTVKGRIGGVEKCPE